MGCRLPRLTRSGRSLCTCRRPSSRRKLAHAMQPDVLDQCFELAPFHQREEVGQRVKPPAGSSLAACLVPIDASAETTGASIRTRCASLTPACGAWTMWTPSFVTSNRGNGHGGTKATSGMGTMLVSGVSNARCRQRRCGTGQRAAALIGASRPNRLISRRHRRKTSGSFMGQAT
jgi:hypothetical protein